MPKSTPLFPIPGSLASPAAAVAASFRSGRPEEAADLAREELARLDKALPATLKRPEAAPDSISYQYHALTLLWVSALAAQARWKDAKEVLGRYRVRFPRDPWGFRAGAEVTRRDTQVKDPAAVQRAIELLEMEAARLEGMAEGRPVKK